MKIRKVDFWYALTLLLVLATGLALALAMLAFRRRDLQTTIAWTGARPGNAPDETPRLRPTTRHTSAMP